MAEGIQIVLLISIGLVIGFGVGYIVGWTKRR